MVGPNSVRAECARCRASILVSQQDYQRGKGELYCEECLVPFQCDTCGERKYTVPEDISPNSAPTCRDCLARLENRPADRCTVCERTHVDLIEYLGEPMCVDCATDLDIVIEEHQTSLLRAVLSGIGHLLEMSVYLLISLGFAAYAIVFFDLSGWFFFLISAVLLLGGAKASRIFKQEELIDIGYVIITGFFIVVIAEQVSIYDYPLIIGSILIGSLIVHELAHKAIALGFRKSATFTAFYIPNLVFIVVAYLSGLILMLPGAVKPLAVTERGAGIVAAAGPVSNIILSFVFAALYSQYPVISYFGATLNLVLAGINMIPFGPLDGAKVIRWSKEVYFSLLAFLLPVFYGMFIT